MAGVLATLIRMHHHLGFGIPAPNSHQQGIEYQFLGDPGLHRPAHYLPGEQINYHSQVQPAFMGTDMRNIRTQVSSGAMVANRRCRRLGATIWAAPPLCRGFL